MNPYTWRSCPENKIVSKIRDDIRVVRVLIYLTRSHLKNRILAQGQGGTEFQPAGILKYVEDLKRGPNTEIGEKDLFEIASKQNLLTQPPFTKFMSQL